MNCQLFEEWISDYLDGQLAAAERADFDAHRHMCPDCRELFKQIQDVVALCRAFPEAEPPVTLLERILSATLGEKRRVMPRSYFALSRLQMLFAPRFAVAFSLVLCFIGLTSGLVLPSKSDEGGTPLAILARLDVYTHKIYSRGIQLYNAKNQFMAQYQYLKTAVFSEIDYHLSQLTGQAKEPSEKPASTPQQKEAPKEEKKSSLPDFFAPTRAPAPLHRG